eukprot:TRINITY_DN12231_c0_g1_i11.p1 TRINITY_DN12231_c0_g1~~TRINITY_DN12231_c0_g1_i11.p1  ORF type:complete len:606 (+),score=157.40 TRINITY_DN12231_c0_g1_i11:125-1942(+)
MKALLDKNHIYLSLSRWSQPFEENKEETKDEDIYTSSDENDAQVPSPSKAKIVTADFRPNPKLTAELSPGKTQPPIKRKRRAKFNPNAIYVKYSELLELPATELKEPLICCKQCDAAFDNLNNKMEKNKWICQICKCGSEIKGKIPKMTSSCFRCEVEHHVKRTVVEKNADYIIIIDTSGSMSITARYDSANYKNNRTALQLLIETLDERLKEIMETSPNAKVGIIVINATVRLLGDCLMSPKVLDEPATLENDRKLRLSVQKLKESFFRTPISQSIGKIKEKLHDLEENGTTALGPAIVCGLELLKDKKNGKMLIFTDGLSNVGIGDLTAENEKDREANKNYYTYWGSVAREQGTEVNFYTIINPESPFDVSLYYPMVRDVNGSICAVTPDKILEDIGLPMEKTVLARDARVTITLPAGLKYTAAVLRFQEKSSKALIMTNSRFTKAYGKLVVESKELLHFVANPEALDREEAVKLKSFLVCLKLEWTDNNNRRHLLRLTQEFPVLNKKSNKMNPEAVKEAMIACREERVRNNQQSTGVEELTDLIDNYLGDQENEVVMQQKKEAEETRKIIEKSKKNKAATMEFFTSRTVRPENRAATTKLNC